MAAAIAAPASPALRARPLERLTALSAGAYPYWRLVARAAFAVAAGDVDALKDVMRRCSAFWKGVSSLVVPVQRDGRISTPQ